MPPPRLPRPLHQVQHTDHRLRGVECFAKPEPVSLACCTRNYAVSKTSMFRHMIIVTIICLLHFFALIALQVSSFTQCVEHIQSFKIGHSVDGLSSHSKVSIIRGAKTFGEILFKSAFDHFATGPGLSTHTSSLPDPGFSCS